MAYTFEDQDDKTQGCVDGRKSPATEKQSDEVHVRASFREHYVVVELGELIGREE